MFLATANDMGHGNLSSRNNITSPVILNFMKFIIIIITTIIIIIIIIIHVLINT